MSYDYSPTTRQEEVNLLSKGKDFSTTKWILWKTGLQPRTVGIGASASPGQCWASAHSVETEYPPHQLTCGCLWNEYCMPCTLLELQRSPGIKFWVCLQGAFDLPVQSRNLLQEKSQQSKATRPRVPGGLWTATVLGVFGIRLLAVGTVSARLLR